MERTQGATSFKCGKSEVRLPVSLHPIGDHALAVEVEVALHDGIGGRAGFAMGDLEHDRIPGRLVALQAFFDRTPNFRGDQMNAELPHEEDKQNRIHLCPVTSRYCAPEELLDFLMPFIERLRPACRRDIHNVNAGIIPNTDWQNDAANAWVKPPGPPLVVTTIPTINNPKITQMIARQIWFPFQEAP